MLASSLVFALVVGVLVAYFVPARVARKYALSTSREGDRFATQISLVETKTAPQSKPTGRSAPLLLTPPANATLQRAPKSWDSPQVLQQPGQSWPSLESVPLASSASGHTHKQIGLSVEEIPAMIQDSASTTNAVQEYAAMRAKRAARLSREEAAAQRRLVTSAIAGVIFLLVAVLAFLGKISWGWAIIPAVLLAGTLVSSVLQGRRAAERSAEEKKQLERLRKLAEGNHQHLSRTLPPAGPFSGFSRDLGERARYETRNEKGNEDVSPIQENSSSDGPFGPGGPQGGGRKRKDRLSAEVEEVARVEGILTDVIEADRSHDAQSQDASPREAVGAEAVVESVAPVSADEKWEVPDTPSTRQDRMAKVAGRQVHPDTDIFAVHRVQASVPARPIYGGAIPLSQNVSIGGVSSETGSTLRFNLDAVLEQRRAQ